MYSRLGRSHARPQDKKVLTIFQRQEGAWNGCVVDNEVREVASSQALTSPRAAVGGVP